MIRYENRIKMQEIRRLIDENQYIQAAKVVDSLEIHKIKSLTDLSVIADVLIQNERYDEGLQILSSIYAKSKTRRVLYQLVDLSIKSKNIEEAEKYLLQYSRVAPQDSYRFIFRYSIDKLKNEPYEVLIESLEELKEYEYIEKWAYELAKLYHKAGMKDRCVRECSDIILWFGDGIYVEKAKLLKGYYVGDIDPIRMLKAKEKKEAEQRLELDKTKDYSSMKNEIDKFIEEDEKEDERVDEIQDKETVQEIQEGGVEDQMKDDGSNLSVEPVEISKEDLNEEIEEIKDERDEEQEEGEKISLLDTRLEQIFGRTNLDYNKVFGYFIHNLSCKSQIVDFLEYFITRNEKNSHLIISGNKKTGKTTLAKKIAKALYGCGRLSSARIAKITATKINYINLDDNFDKLKDSTLIIEEAGSLNNNGVQQLLRLMWCLEGHIFVIIEDSQEAIAKLLDLNESLKSRFGCQIILPTLTEDDLFQYAYNHIMEQDYQLSADAEALLKDIIYEIGKEESDNKLEVVMNIVKEAILQADERNREELVRKIGSQKLSETDLLYINVEDFQSVYGEE